MRQKMSIDARREQLLVLRPRYKAASWSEKIEILDGFVASSGYNRKYATVLLNSEPADKDRGSSRSTLYDEQTKAALIFVWLAANRICSKRLKPFLPTLVERLKKFGHFQFSDDVTLKLLSMSTSTMDRCLKDERRKYSRSISSTKSVSKLRQQILLRTVGDPHPSLPGYCEVDLVAHNGGNTSGSFLHTLTVTDIATGWTEVEAIQSKGEIEVLNALKVIQRNLPFVLLGIDSDNGGEFINHLLKDFCDSQNIEFTRCREYRKNDQAHVEQKNGSIVRRFIGYDRYTSQESRSVMCSLYRVARLFINFFQPSLKLIHKQRTGSKTRKLYDTASTPFERILASNLPADIKCRLENIFENLDPMVLLHDLRGFQNELWLMISAAQSSNIKEPCPIPPKPKLKRERKPQPPRRRPLPHKKLGRQPSTKYDQEIFDELTNNPSLYLRDIMSILKSRHKNLAITKQTVMRRVHHWRAAHPALKHQFPDWNKKPKGNVNHSSMVRF